MPAFELLDWIIVGMYFVIFLFLGCIATMIVVSLLTKEPSYEKLQGLVYGTTAAGDKAESRASWNYADVIHSVVIVGVIVVVLLYFTG